MQLAGSERNWVKLNQIERRFEYEITIAFSQISAEYSLVSSFIVNIQVVTRQRTETHSTSVRLKWIFLLFLPLFLLLLLLRGLLRYFSFSFLFSRLKNEGEERKRRRPEESS